MPILSIMYLGTYEIHNDPGISSTANGRPREAEGGGGGRVYQN